MSVGITEEQWAEVVAFPGRPGDDERFKPTPYNTFIPGDRVAEIYADTTGQVKRILGVFVQVEWDVPQPEDDLLPPPTFDELVRLV